MLPYSWNDLNDYYSLLVTKAWHEMYVGNYVKSIQCIESAGFLQSRLNDIYTDERLENLLHNISSHRYKRKLIEVNKKRYIFYEGFGWDNRGLTLQYIDALNHLSGCEYIFIFEKRLYEHSQKIVNNLLNNNARIVELEGDVLAKADTFHEIILSYCPSKVFLHLASWSTIPFIVLDAFSQITKYQINLTDHAFWIGSHFIDYSLEFRDYGCTVSLEKRGLLKKQILLLPYYPFDDMETFKGFPISTEGKIVMFSGGSFYKIYGADNFYLNLVVDLLWDNPNLVFIYAGDGDDSAFRSFMEQKGLIDRVALLGFRKDINEIFKHIDIYLGTYPYSGGLMSQYAAMYGKPLLVYDETGSRVEDIVCTKRYEKFVFSTKKALLDEAHKLINNITYRKERGRFFKSLMAGQDDFRQGFRNLLEKNQSKREYTVKDIDYKSFANQYLEAINEGNKGFSVELYILKALGLSVFYQTPKIVFNLLPYCYKRATTFIKSRFVR